MNNYIIVLYSIIHILILVHSPYNLFRGEDVRDFPISYKDDNYNFVGCYIYEDDSRCEKHHMELKE